MKPAGGERLEKAFAIDAERRFRGGILKAARIGEWTETRAWLVLAAIFLCAAYLSLKGLDNASLWTDEAQDAMFARNLARTGRLTGWDGRNLMAYQNGGTLRDDLGPVNAPLGMMCMALSYKVFGVSTWSTRFPFVLLGLASFLVFAAILRSDYGMKDPWLWTYGLGLYGLSTWFLLYTRSARYYSPIFLFTLGAFYSYRSYLKTRKQGYLHLLSLSAALAFLSNPMLCVAFMASMVVAHLLFHPRAFSAKDWLNAATGAVLFLALVLPYVFSFRIWDRPDFAAYAKEPWLGHHLALLWWNLRDLNLLPCLPFPIFVAAICIYAVLGRRDASAATMAEWGAIGLGNVGFIALFSPQATVNPDPADVRYLVASCPLLWGVAAAVLAFLARWSRLAAAAVFAVLLSCNLFSLLPAFGPGYFRWLLPAYWREIHNPYPTSSQVAIGFLDACAKPDDLVCAVPDFMNYPLMFYRGSQWRFCCLLDRQTHLPASVVQALNAPLSVDSNFPDWLVVFRSDRMSEALLRHFSRPHSSDGKTVRFSYEPVATMRVDGRETQRPELCWHSFWPIPPNEKTNTARILQKRVAESH